MYSTNRIYLHYQFEITRYKDINLNNKTLIINEYYKHRAQNKEED